ncbi:acyltransferase domain-containing protein, partial [Streptomyces sp. V4-01]|nr:acyltransferase domain-containing protein [Streptomyces sp. V4-01]
MAEQLATTHPVFAHTLDQCAQALDPYLDTPLHHVLNDPTALQRVDIVQPALFAVMVSLAALWRSHGIHPAAVIGHSQGEIAAAHVAGALTLPDAARIIALRSQALTTLTGNSGMISLHTTATHTHHLIQPWKNHLHIAAHNSPTTTIVSGTTPALQALLTHCHTHGIHARTIPVDYASHSPHMEPLHTPLTHLLAPTTPQPLTTPMYSTTHNTWLHGTELTPHYWYENIRQPVTFHPAIHTLTTTHHHHHYLEISPHPVLTPAIHDTL